MKNRLVSLAIQTIANVVALWFIFVKKNSYFVSLLNKIGIHDQKAQIGILAAFTTLITSLVIIFLEWLVFEIIFKPVKLEISFRNPSGKNPIKKLNIEYNSHNTLDIQRPYKLHISVSEGNKITNKILNLLKSDLVLSYRPKYYDTEITNGWLSETNMSSDNIYKDKKNNTRIYWSHILEGAGNIESPLITVSELIVKPKNFDGYKCQVELRMGSHSRRNPLIRSIFKVIYLKLVIVDTKKLTLYLKKVDK